jgi:DNA repair protein RecO (recombination protein O)
MAQGRLVPHHSEAIVLRTWPFHEADLLLSLFTREQGRIKGVARHAMRSRKRFGGALEPATYVRAHYTERPKQDLVRLDSFEILWSPMTAPASYLRTAGMQLVLEVMEEALPEQATEDNVFRLAMTVLTAMEGGDVWLPVTYYCLWMNRLMGWWPALSNCVVCGRSLRDESVWWSPTSDGVTCEDDCKSGSSKLTHTTLRSMAQIFRSPLPELPAEVRTHAGNAQPLLFGIGLLERHLDRRLRSARPLMSPLDDLHR